MDHTKLGQALVLIVVCLSCRVSAADDWTEQYERLFGRGSSRPLPVEEAKRILLDLKGKQSSMSDEQRNRVKFWTELASETASVRCEKSLFKSIDENLNASDGSESLRELAKAIKSDLFTTCWAQLDSKLSSQVAKTDQKLKPYLDELLAVTKGYRANRPNEFDDKELVRRLFEAMKQSTNGMFDKHLYRSSDLDWNVVTYKQWYEKRAPCSILVRDFNYLREHIELMSLDENYVQLDARTRTVCNRFTVCDYINRNVDLQQLLMNKLMRKVWSDEETLLS